MSKVYSHLLWADAQAAGTHPGPVVPSTQLWVVRTVSIEAPLPRWSAPNGFVLEDGAGIPLAGWAQGEHVGGFFYTWNGHQMLEPGDQLTAVTGTDGYTWRVSGFRLDLP